MFCSGQPREGKETYHTSITHKYRVAALDNHGFIFYGK